MQIKNYLSYVSYPMCKDKKNLRKDKKPFARLRMWELGTAMHSWREKLVESFWRQFSNMYQNLQDVLPLTQQFHF